MSDELTITLTPGGFKPSEWTIHVDGPNGTYGKAQVTSTGIRVTVDNLRQDSIHLSINTTAEGADEVFTTLKAVLGTLLEQAVRLTGQQGSQPDA